MRKIVCPYCGKILEVDENKDYEIKCDECNTTFTINDGIKSFDRNYQMLKKKGFRLYSRLKFVESNECYETLLKMNLDDFDIRSKYILNLLYLNTLSSTNYDKVIPLLEESSITLDSTNTYLFLAFLKDVLQNVHVYFSYTSKYLVNENKVFLNEKYTLTYFKTLKDILDVLTYLKDTMPLLKEGEKEVFFEDESNSNVLPRLEKYLSRCNEELESSHNLVNKGEFKFNKDSLTLDFIPTPNENIIKLDEVSYDDERVIRPSKKFQKEMRLFYSLSGTLIGIGLIFVILGFTLNNDVLKYLTFVPLAALIIYFIIFFKRINK